MKGEEKGVDCAYTESTPYSRRSEFIQEIGMEHGESEMSESEAYGRLLSTLF